MLINVIYDMLYHILYFPLTLGFTEFSDALYFMSIYSECLHRHSNLIYLYTSLDNISVG